MGDFVLCSKTTCLIHCIQGGLNRPMFYAMGVRMDRIELQQLRYLTAVADAGSFTGAAKRLYVSQQALSHGVKCLEEAAGKPLLERGRMGVSLTAAGEVVYEQAQRVLAGVDEMAGLFSAWRSGFDSSIAVGVHSLCFQRNGGTLNGDMLLRFKDGYPDVDFSFSETDNNSIQSGVLASRLNFGIGIPPVKGVEGKPLYDFPLAAVFSADEIVGVTCASENGVTLAELSRGSLVAFADDASFNKIFLEAAARDGVTVRMSPLSTSAGKTVEDVLAGPGTYIIKPLQHALRTIHDSNMLIVPVVDKADRPVLVPLRVFWKSGRVLTRVECEFVAHIERLYREAKH